MNWKSETVEHINKVFEMIQLFKNALQDRSTLHDYSKLDTPESDYFEEYTSKLKNTTYGSDEYKKYLEEMKPALDHHYLHNRHHPEHFEDGIKGMNLVDIIEMFCDWFAATQRHNDGDIYKSIAINKKRFKYGEILESIFNNTSDDIFSGEL